MPTGLPSSASPGRCRAVTRTLQQGATAEVTPGGSSRRGRAAVTVSRSDSATVLAAWTRPVRPARPCPAAVARGVTQTTVPGPGRARPCRGGLNLAVGRTRRLGESDSPWHSLSGRLQSHGDSEDDRVTRALRRRGPAGAGPAGHSLADRRTRCDRVRPLQWSRLVPFNCLLSYGHRV